MSAGSSRAFPGGSTLAAWWRQLAPWHPEGLVGRAAADTAALSEAGLQALEHGEFVRPQRERRNFYFWQADWPTAETSSEKTSETTSEKTSEKNASPVPPAHFVALAQP